MQQIYQRSILLMCAGATQITGLILTSTVGVLSHASFTKLPDIQQTCLLRIPLEEEEFLDGIELVSQAYTIPFLIF